MLPSHSGTVSVYCSSVERQRRWRRLKKSERGQTYGHPMSQEEAYSQNTTPRETRRQVGSVGITDCPSLAPNIKVYTADTRGIEPLQPFQAATLAESCGYLVSPRIQIGRRLLSRRLPSYPRLYKVRMA